MKYNPADYYVDFSTRSDLTDAEKAALQIIQNTYLPLERADHLQEYRSSGKISDDEFERMTGIPYKF
jgi:hypothetical protein